MSDIQRNMGLMPAIATMTGCVVGASIFIVPGALSAASGPNAWLSYIIGAVLILFSCFVYVQVGAAIPVSGANYRLCTGCINGITGFLYVWCYFLGYSFLFPIMAKTAATYLAVFIPAVNDHILLVSVLIIVLTGCLNLLGTAVSGKIQTACVALLIIVVCIFSCGGIVNADWSHFTPMFPKGISPVIIGVVSTYYAYAGVNCIIDMSGDIKNPGKNIPRTVFISMLLVIIMYVGMSVALVGVQPWEELGVDAPAIMVSRQIFPQWFAYFVAIAAIAASWTTLNAVYGAMSRVLYVMGRNRIFPRPLATVNKKGVPSVAIIARTIMGVIMCAFNALLMQFVNVSSFYLLLVALLVSAASLRMKKKMPNEYAKAPFRLNGVWYYVWPICAIISSAVFMVIEVVTDTKFAVAAIILIPVGMLVYVMRKKKLESTGVNLDEQIMKDMYSEE